MSHHASPKSMAIDPQECLVHALGQFPGLVWTTDADTVITSALGGGMTTLGLQLNETVGLKLSEYFGTDNPQFPVLEAHRQVMQGELIHLNQHWQGRDFETRMQPVLGDDGSVVGCLGITYDVTERYRAARAMPQSVAEMRVANERAPDFTLHIDRANTITHLESNRPGYDPRPVIGTRIEKWLHPESLPLVEQAMGRVLEHRQPQQFEIPIIAAEQPELWYDVRFRPVIEDESVVGVAAIAYDITERKAVELRLREQVQLLQESEQRFRVLEQELREARRQLEERVMERTQELTAANQRLRDEEQRLQEILDNTTAIVYVKDAQGYYQLINVQFARIFHVTAADVIGKKDEDIFPAETAARFRANDMQVLAERRAIQFDEVAPHDDGPHHYISVKFPLGVATNGPCSVCGISTDITDRKEAEQRLRSEEQLMRKLLELREREQMLLAYDIHDGLVQDVVGAKMRLEARSNERADGAVLDASSYQQILSLLVEAIDEGRRLISELRPPILDEQGIIGSIDYLVAEHLQKNGCRIEFRHEVSFDRLSPLLEQAVFRIVQEALNNIVRHSSAAEAKVQLRQMQRHIHLEISDCGAGFDPAAVSPDRFGLRGIIERARLFGGRATIESRPAAGTRIVVQVPMDQPLP